MKIITEIVVKIPRNEFISKIDNVENLKYWQSGFSSAEHLSGVPGELGAKMRLIYNFGNRKMELIETIAKRKFPEEFHANYTTKGMNNIQENYFERTSEGFTKWISKNEFLPLNFMTRLYTIFMPNAFKKQSEKYMQDFKNFAENAINGAHA